MTPSYLRVALSCWREFSIRCLIHGSQPPRVSVWVGNITPNGDRTWVQVQNEQRRPRSESKTLAARTRRQPPNPCANPRKPQTQSRDQCSRARR